MGLPCAGTLGAFLVAESAAALLGNTLIVSPRSPIFPQHISGSWVQPHTEHRQVDASVKQYYR